MCCIGMAAIRQVQNDAFLNLQHVQSKESQMNMLIYYTLCTTSVITAANLPSVFAKTNHCGLFFSLIFCSLSKEWQCQRPWLSVPWLNCHICFLSAGRQWWDDNHVQHDLQGLSGGGWTRTHLWGFQQGHTLFQDPDSQTQCLLWVHLSVLSIFSKKKKL